MKGWSFRGLVEALGTAAFKAVGALKGQVPLVGDKGLLDTAPNIPNVNFNTYPYKNNETFIALAPHASWPFSDEIPAGYNYLVTVLGVWGSGGCALLISSSEQTLSDSVFVREGGVWRSKNKVQFKELIAENLNTFNKVNTGIWVQKTSVEATLARGYPVAEEAGVLEVYPSPYGVAMKYTAFASGRTFNRQTYNETGSWTPWLEDLKTNSKQNCALGWTEASAVSFPWGGIANQNSVVEKSGKDTLQISWGAGTTQTPIRRFLNVGGVFATMPVSLGWRDIYDGYGRAPYSVEPTVVGPGFWLPHSSQSVTTEGFGYRAVVMTGIQNFSNSYPHYKVIWNLDAGVNTQFFFTPEGNIHYDGGGSWPNQTFATQTYSANLYNDNRNYMNQTFVSNIGLGVYQEVALWEGPGYVNEHPWVITSVRNYNADGLPDFVGRRPLHMYFPSRGWINFAST